MQRFAIPRPNSFVVPVQLTTDSIPHLPPVAPLVRSHSAVAAVAARMLRPCADVFVCRAAWAFRDWPAAEMDLAAKGVSGPGEMAMPRASRLQEPNPVRRILGADEPGIAAAGARHDLPHRPWAVLLCVGQASPGGMRRYGTVLLAFEKQIVCCPKKIASFFNPSVSFCFYISHEGTLHASPERSVHSGRLANHAIFFQTSYLPSGSENLHASF